MTIQPTPGSDSEMKIENTGAPSAVQADAPPPLAASDASKSFHPEALPVEGQMRVLRLLDAETAATTEPEAEILEEFALGEDIIVIEADPLLQGSDLLDLEALDLTNATAEAHSHAAPPPLTEPGEVIDLLSGTEALAAMDGRVPFDWPEDLDADSYVFHSGHGEAGQSFAENAALGGPSSDLIFLDFTPFAKPAGTPGNGGGGNGGGGNGGDDSVDGGGDSGVLSEYLSGTSDLSDDGSEYNILIDFKGSWTTDLQDAFIWAADWISGVITGDVADVFYRGKVIDDIRITAELTNIDGPGGTLGQAGPTAVRTAGYLPAAGKMEFDVADAEVYDLAGNWETIVIHEMLHTIGFGTIWDFLDLVDGSGTSTPTFTGTEAVLAYADLFGGGGDYVPLESGYGPGTNESHWDEADFGNEIMTGFINNSNYMSGMTVASLIDLGYETAYEGVTDWATEFTAFNV